MSNKKEYNNIFAKMAEEHNNSVVPVLKNLKLNTVKIRNRRILTLRDVLETSEDILLSIDLFTEYLVVNTFILKLIDEKQLESGYELIRTKNKENFLIGSNIIYSLVESKKNELLNT